MPKLTSRQLRLGLLLALVPFLLIELVRFGDPPSAADGDYAQYLLHAKALVEGRPYSDIGYIYTDLNFVGPQNQPPGWPLVLAPFVLVFGIGSPVFQVLMGVLVGGFAIAAGLYFARRSQPGVGIAIAAIVALSVQAQGATGSAVSDPLFCLLVWITLYVADREGQWTWRRSLLLAGLSIATPLVRVAGIALLPALVLQSLFAHGVRRWRMALLIGGVVAAGVMVLLVADVAIPFVDRIKLLDKVSFRQVDHMFETYRTSFLAGTLYPFVSNRWNDLYHAALVPFVAIGAFQFVRKEAKSPAAFFALTYIGLLWVAPVRESRYAWPLLPILVYCLAVGWLQVVGFVARALKSDVLAGRVSAVAVFLLCVASVGVQLRTPRPPTLHGDPKATEVFSYFSELGSRTSVRAIFENPRVLTLETGVPAMGVPFGAERRLIAELQLQRITHVVVRSGIGKGFFTDGDLKRLIGAHPLEFPVLFENGTFSVHAVQGLDSIPVDSARAGPG
jgi:MFS family permease